MMSRRRGWMLAVIMLAGGACAAMGQTASSGGHAASPEQVFRSGNEFYEQGNYEAAIEQYRSLVDGGVGDPELFYNLGNAYYKNNELGRSVLSYLRSLRMQPRNKDARENLALVRSQLRDKQFVRNQNRFVRGMIWLHNNLSAREMLLFASLSYLLLCLLVVALIFRDTRVVTKLYRGISVVSPGRLIGLTLVQDVLVAVGVVMILFVTAGISSYQKIDAVQKQREAVVLAGEIPVFSSPTDDATLQFKIHEGTLVGIAEQGQGWTKIELPGGMSGWVASDAIERV